MNRGLMAKALREAGPATLLFGLGLATVETLLAYLIPILWTASPQQLLGLRFVQSFLRGVLGTEAGEMVGPEVIASIPWAHPIVLALVWGHEITLCTRVPAGEVDRGTIDVLLGLPVSRLRLYLCESTVWLLSGLVLFTLALVGKLVGERLTANPLPGTREQIASIFANLGCLYLAVGGVAWLVSAMSDRRGRAVGVAFAFVLTSFLLHFIAQFGGFARSIVFLSLMHYYRPLLILRESSWPLADMLILLSVAFASWTAGAIVFARRDIRAN